MAEVLITLGIIGVVAAMTIPTLVANTKSKQYSAQFKKTLSVVNQAARMGIAQYDMDFTADEDYSGCSAADTPETKQTLCALLNVTLAGATYMGNGTAAQSTYGYPRDNGVMANVASSPTNFILYQLADGSIFGTQSGPFCTKGKAGMPQCAGFIDVNGVKGPNKAVQCKDEEKTAYNIYGAEKCEADTSNMNDVFPVIVYDQTVEPASNAAKDILNSAK